MGSGFCGCWVRGFVFGFWGFEFLMLGVEG